MKTLAIAITMLLVIPAYAEETLGEKAKDAGEAITDAAKTTGEVIKGAAEKVVDEAEELFTDEEARKVEVKLTEHRIDMPSSLEQGKTRFAVTNAGEEKHNFEVEGQGVEKKFMMALRPGQTKNLDVELKPGEYTVYCPIEDHAEKGMKMTLSVK